MSKNNFTNENEFDFWISYDDTPIFINPEVDVCTRIFRGNWFPFMPESGYNLYGPSGLGEVIIIIIDQ